MSHAAVAAVALRFFFFFSLTQIHEKTARLGFVCLHEYAYGEGRAIQQKNTSFSLDWTSKAFFMKGLKGLNRNDQTCFSDQTTNQNKNKDFLTNIDLIFYLHESNFLFGTTMHEPCHI